MKVPILLRRGDQAEPSENLWYEVAANGIFQVRRTPFYRAVTRTNELLPDLLPLEEELVYCWPPLPAALLEQVLAFFREMWRTHRSEGVVIVFYDPAAERFCVRAPPQTVSPGGWGTYAYAAHHVSYGRVERPQGYLRFGTIHSHANLPAFASETDCADESFEDGMHAVYGDLDRELPSRSACFVANGVRFQLEPSSVLEDASPDARPAPREWLERVTREKPATIAWGGSSWAPARERQESQDGSKR